MTFFNPETDPDPDLKPTFEQKTETDPDRLPKAKSLSRIALASMHNTIFFVWCTLLTMEIPKSLSWNRLSQVLTHFPNNGQIYSGIQKHFLDHRI
jgi:hypothetical protein